MKCRGWVFLSLLAAAGPLSASEERLATLKVGTDVYTNVTVTSVTASQVYFTHSGGMANAKLKELDPATQQLFHYNAVKAAAQEAEQTQANALYAKAALETPPPKRQPSTQRESTEPPVEVPEHTIHAKSFLNQPAPTILAEKWLTPSPDTKGKFVLLDFWATWCGPCRASIPKLNGFQAKYKDRLVVIGLSDEAEAAVRRMTNPKIEYAVAIDTQARASHAVEVRGIPHAMLVDLQGIVRFEGNPHLLTEPILEGLMAKYSR